MNRQAEKFRKITMKVLTMQLNSITIMDLIAYGGAALGMILSRKVFFTALEAKYPILLEKVVQRHRTTTAPAATPKVASKVLRSTVPANRLARRLVTQTIMTRFATREIHWHNTLPAMYRLLSLTMPISRLLSIPSIHSSLLLVSSR